MSLEPGSVIDDKYRVVRLIGEGGMGAVYLGENSRIKRQVAIKILHAKVAGNAEVVQRFEREAQAAGTIGNDHILEVLDLGSLPNGDRFIVMEYLDGEPLAQRMERLKRLTPAQIVPIITQLLDGLGAAHGAGITHRDLKPDNVFLLRKKAGQRDFVKIIDFGISKFAQSENGVKMTQAGVIMGTPLYMSPEQARSSEADARSDLYSVGVMMFEAASGRVPFTGEAFNELLIQIVLGDVTPLIAAAPDVDQAFSAIVMKAMARDPRDRFQTAEDLKAALEEWRVTVGGGSRISGAAPTMAMSQTPIPWQPSQPQGALQGTPYPGQQGTPYPGQQGTPYPARPGTPQPGQGSSAVNPYAKGAGAPPRAVAQGTSHSWGASQSGPPGTPPPARSKKPMAMAGLGAAGVLVLAAFGIMRLSHGASSAPPAPAVAGAAAQPPIAAASEIHLAPPPVVLAPMVAASSSSKEESTPTASGVAPAVASSPSVPSAALVRARSAAASASAPPKPPANAKPAAPKPSNKSEPDFGY